MCGASTISRFFLVVSFGHLVLGSAIPMWEFLSRTEKMNLLYSMFVKQVNDYCVTVVMPDGTDCNKVLLLYGLTNLAKMGEDSLDKMDPYQRDATVIIWQSMMKGTFKPMEDSPENHKIHTTKFDDNETGSGDNNLGYQAEESSNIPQYTSTDNKKFITGPMIMRLLPNGNPIPGEPQIPMVKDEDAEDFKLMRSHPPSDIMELATSDQQFHPKLEENDYFPQSHKSSSPVH